MGQRIGTQAPQRPGSPGFGIEAAALTKTIVTKSVKQTGE